METKKRPLDLTTGECGEFSLVIWGQSSGSLISGEQGKNDAEVSYLNHLKNLVVKSRLLTVGQVKISFS